jgi:hypothetical protein
MGSAPSKRYVRDLHTKTTSLQSTLDLKLKYSTLLLATFNSQNFATIFRTKLEKRKEKIMNRQKSSRERT